MVAAQWFDPVTQFAELYENTYKKVHDYVWRIVPSEADDLTQETYLKAYKARYTYVPKAPPVYWILRIAHNEAISYLRTGQAKEVELPVRDIRVAPDARLKQIEDRELLQRLGAHLTPVQVEALNLRYLQDFTLTQIADEYQIPVRTLTGRVHTALGNLRLMVAADAV